MNKLHLHMTYICEPYKHVEWKKLNMKELYDSTFINSSKQAKLICGLVLMTVITFAEEQEE